MDVLNTMLNRIKTGFESQKRFTADASHELRSPLTVMRGEIEVALRRERPPKEYQQVLGSTLEEVDRLTRITENLLTLARSDGGALEIRTVPCSVIDLVEGVVARLRPLGDQKGIVLTVHCDPNLVWELDAGMFRQVVWNVLENSLKFTPSEGSVDLIVDQAGDNLRVVVDDSGPGFQAGAPDPFERFSRADQVRTPGPGETGSGLGLAIVKALVEIQGGSVDAVNRPGGGARVTVVLPEVGVVARS